MTKNKFPKKLILISLNEINFDLAKKYIKKYKFKNFKYLLSEKFQNYTTSSEKKYELLEPWIQWVSVYTGLSADEHKIFRLGDVVNQNTDQIFEKIEKLNFKVGAISPMNASNQLKSPSYFIPDPWTQTNSDESFWSKIIAKILSETVNQNAKNKIKLSTLLVLVIIILKFVRFRKYFTFFKLFVSSRKKKWRKAIFLDLLINEIHLKFFKNSKPNFTNIFLNSGAHIQHHHFLRSIFVDSQLNNKNISDDPIYDSLFYYDILLNDYIHNRSFDLIVYTGLTQTPNKEPVYYYRLKNHKKFLDMFDIKYKDVYPRMSRDFLIKFDDIESSKKCLTILENIKADEKVNIFKEIDYRYNSIFVTLTYSRLINKDIFISYENKKFNFYNLVDFVAIKNGIHNEKGYLFCSNKVAENIDTNSLNVKNIHNVIVDYFIK